MTVGQKGCIVRYEGNHTTSTSHTYTHQQTFKAGSIIAHFLVHSLAVAS
jgi:hypothetical protein